MAVIERDSVKRKQFRRRIRAQRPPCGICHKDIDYKLHYLNPGAFVVDHVIPLAQGGEDVIDNCQAAHRHCNRVKSDKMPDEAAAVAAPRTFITARSW